MPHAHTHCAMWASHSGTRGMRDALVFHNHAYRRPLSFLGEVLPVTRGGPLLPALHTQAHRLVRRHATRALEQGPHQPPAVQPD